MKIVYICSPYAGNIERNEENARRYCRFAIEKGYLPLAPHLLFPQFLNDEDPNERDVAMAMNMILLRKCSELWVFGDVISKGMAMEIEEAKDLNMLTKYFKNCEVIK